MGRNHFSRAGGPYFINDGVSHHTDHDHKEGHNHDDIKPSNPISGLLAAIAILIPVCMSILVFVIL